MLKDNLIKFQWWNNQIYDCALSLLFSLRNYRSFQSEKLFLLIPISFDLDLGRFNRTQCLYWTKNLIFRILCPYKYLLSIFAYYPFAIAQLWNYLSLLSQLHDLRDLTTKPFKDYTCTLYLAVICCIHRHQQ